MSDIARNVPVDLPSCVGLWPELWFKRHSRLVADLAHLGVGGDRAHSAAQSCIADRAASGAPYLPDADRVVLVQACAEALDLMVRGALRDALDAAYSGHGDRRRCGCHAGKVECVACFVDEVLRAGRSVAWMRWAVVVAGEVARAEDDEVAAALRRAVCAWRRGK